MTTKTYQKPKETPSGRIKVSPVPVILKETRDYAANLGIEKLIVWSDDCSAQYKSKLPFYFAAGAPDERAYFGSRHGKGPCDVCGGVVKRILDDDFMSGDVIIQSAESMYNHLNLGTSRLNDSFLEQTMGFVDATVDKSSWQNENVCLVVCSLIERQYNAIMS
ncbi:hypothetical protein LOTGIDRAFT_173706 [Lottia gigantea]|uniref:Uncharacterized protein n=1 Tax=Lottia gigantea TaxID=225164 RepID=V4CCE4_LOTGI|nr:hypothetical protein LOTGIDRAFT_173706 [Lottia gigantea]ESO99564.1 hypothetical protein LOTGIDRAFT_173706 [Lottia gigantea]